MNQKWIKVKNGTILLYVNQKRELEIQVTDNAFDKRNLTPQVNLEYQKILRRGMTQIFDYIEQVRPVSLTMCVIGRSARTVINVNNELKVIHNTDTRYTILDDSVEEMIYIAEYVSYINGVNLNYRYYLE